MTTFDRTLIPASFTVEQLAVWSCCILQELYPTIKVTENIEIAPQLVAQINGYDLPIATDANWTYTVERRAIARMSIPLIVEWKRNKLWLGATNIGTSATPTAFYS